MTGTCARLVRGDRGGSTSAKNHWKTWPPVLLRVLSRAEAGRPRAEAEEFRGGTRGVLQWLQCLVERRTAMLRQRSISFLVLGLRSAFKKRTPNIVHSGLLLRSGLKRRRVLQSTLKISKTRIKLSLVEQRRPRYTPDRPTRPYRPDSPTRPDRPTRQDSVAISAQARRGSLTGGDRPNGSRSREQPRGIDRMAQEAASRDPKDPNGPAAPRHATRSLARGMER